jgi:hypothetical protein
VISDAVLVQVHHFIPPLFAKGAAFPVIYAGAGHRPVIYAKGGLIE